MPDRDLIFDLGMFDGGDTSFYLAKGFRVVALEARADLCAAARTRFAQEIMRGQLTIVERALFAEDDVLIPFYVRGDWSSVHRRAAERDGVGSETAQALTVTLKQLVSKFGVPHFLKCDIEGSDITMLEGMQALNERPTFVSVEDPDGSFVALFKGLGYDRFQMINQGYLSLMRPPSQSREGKPVAHVFDTHSSGLFGFDLPADRWVDGATILRQFETWRSLREKRINRIAAHAMKRWGKFTRRGWLIPGGWADVHATTAAALNSSS